MSATTTISIPLSAELQDFIRDRVASGRYRTPAEVVREGLRLLEHLEREWDEDLRSLKTKLDRGAAQADRGELIDDDEVRVWLEQQEQRS